MADETLKNENKPWLFQKGNKLGKGAPKLTKDKIVEKKAVNQIVKEYRQKLAEALPKIEPVLVKKAEDGDVQAIKELHNRVMGLPPQRTDITSQGEKIVPILGGLTIQNEEDK